MSINQSGTFFNVREVQLKLTIVCARVAYGQITLRGLFSYPLNQRKMTIKKYGASIVLNLCFLVLVSKNGLVPLFLKRPETLGLWLLFRP